MSARKLSENTRRILGEIPDVWEMQRREVFARRRYRTLVEQVQVFGGLDQARQRTFNPTLRPQQELQLAAEEIPVETESPVDREVTNDDGFASFIRDSPETDDVAV